jgi:predicted HicB family RNase H-like nuclease
MNTRSKTLPPENLKSAAVTLRVREKDKAAWETQAAKNGMTLSNWIVQTLNKGLKHGKSNDHD